jgi:hypothetical protein
VSNFLRRRDGCFGTSGRVSLRKNSIFAKYRGELPSPTINNNPI